MDTKIAAKPHMDVIKEPIPHLLLPGEMGAVLELIVKDRAGKVTNRQVMRSMSFVRQFLELLWVQTVQITDSEPYSALDTDGLIKDLCETSLTFDATAAANDQTHGIVVGTGTTAPTIEDYTVETVIDHGTGAGELQYGGVTFGLPASDATTSQFTVTRDFANGSGGEVTVTEIALVVKGAQYSITGNFLIIRDVIGGGVAVPNGQTLTVNYREQAVV